MKVGDFVVVVKPTVCCSNGNLLGKTFVISGLIESFADCDCGRYGMAKMAMWDANHAVEIDRLKVIPPLKDLVEEEKTVTA